MPLEFAIPWKSENNVMRTAEIKSTGGTDRIQHSATAARSPLEPNLPAALYETSPPVSVSDYQPPELVHHPNLDLREQL